MPNFTNQGHDPNTLNYDASTESGACKADQPCDATTRSNVTDDDSDEWTLVFEEMKSDFPNFFCSQVADMEEDNPEILEMNFPINNEGPYPPVRVRGLRFNAKFRHCSLTFTFIRDLSKYCCGMSAIRQAENEIHHLYSKHNENRVVQRIYTIPDMDITPKDITAVLFRLQAQRQANLLRVSGKYIFWIKGE